MAHSQLVQSVLRSLDILEQVAAAEDGLALHELAGTLDLKTPTAHNLARTLAARGFLEKSASPTRYRLGPAALEVARRHAHNALLRRAPVVLRKLFAELGQATVTLAQPVGQEVMSIQRISPERPGLIERPRGMSMHPYGTASAVLFQALWTAEQRAAYRRRYPFWQYGAHLWGTERRLERALTQARRRGYARADLDRQGVFPVAAAVVGANHELLASVGAATSVKGSPARRRRVIERVLAAARKLSAEV